MSPYDDGDKSNDSSASDANDDTNDDVFVRSAETGCFRVGLQTGNDGRDVGFSCPC